LITELADFAALFFYNIDCILIWCYCCLRHRDFPLFMTSLF
jgi:hypothetical protein